MFRAMEGDLNGQRSWSTKLSDLQKWESLQKKKKKKKSNSSTNKRSTNTSRKGASTS